jgi:hypothetical protein
MSLDVQKRLFALALDRLGDGEPVNELLQITLDKHTTQTPWSASPRANGLPTPPLEKICQLVLPYREAIASPKLVPEHQHDQRGRESFFASQGDLTSSFSPWRENVTGRLPGDLYRLIPIGSVHCLWLRGFRSTGAGSVNCGRIDHGTPLRLPA